MEKRLSMLLQFPLIKIKPRADFTSKLDQFGMISPPMKTLVGFSRSERTPNLLGMKGMLASLDYCYDHANRTFSVQTES